MGLLEEKKEQSRVITVNYRDCKHERTFTVKTKRGDINTYCADCFKWLRPATSIELAALKKKVGV